MSEALYIIEELGVGRPYFPLFKISILSFGILITSYFLSLSFF